MSCNKKRLTVWSLGLVGLVALFGLVTGCPGTDLLEMGQVSPQEEEAADAMVDVSAMAETLFVRITETDPFEQWAQFPDFEGTQISAVPHGPMSRVYINEQVEAALTNFKGTLPEDSIIVKENIGESESVTEAVLTVMWKVTDFNPDNSDWFWVNVSLEGEFRAQGRVEGCINCHAGARANDFVFVHQF